MFFCRKITSQLHTMLLIKSKAASVFIFQIGVFHFQVNLPDSQGHQATPPIRKSSGSIKPGFLLNAVLLFKQCPNLVQHHDAARITL